MYKKAKKNYNKVMKILREIGLFLSSFVPLFLLLIVKEIIEIINNNWTLNFLNSFLLIVLSIMLFVGIYYLISLLKVVNVAQNQQVEIIKKTNTTDQHFLGYFSLFVLFAISFEIEMYSMAIIFLIVLAMIGVVYIRNDMYYINPLLNMLGYSFYDVEYINSQGKTQTSKVFYKGRLELGKNYFLCTKYSNLFFVKASKDL